MNRFEDLKKSLDNGRYFKVVCGAGNEDPDEVFRLCVVYTLAGALGIDLSANVDVVKAGMAGVDLAYEIAPSLGVTIETRPFINVSIGLKGDPHVRKASINEDKCTECGSCYDHCDQEAILEEPYKVIAQRCIGCGKCEEVCEFEAIEYYTKKVDFEDVLPKCIAAGAENLELHAIIADDEPVMRDWKTVNDILPDQFVSMCLDRSQLSDTRLIERVRQARRVVGERLIIQADGAPMSGGTDNFNTTLQAVACADIIHKSGIFCMILLSGGTNSKTGELARLCGITANGISIGTFARNLIRKEIKLPDFPENLEAISRAFQKAKQLVDVNLEQIKRS